MKESLLKEFEKDLKLEDLNESNQELAEIIGMENFIKISRLYGGITIYINKLEQILYPVKLRHIINEYNGNNKKELARKYNFTEIQITRMLKDGSVLDNKIKKGRPKRSDEIKRIIDFLKYKGVDISKDIETEIMKA